MNKKLLLVYFASLCFVQTANAVSLPDTSQQSSKQVTMNSETVTVSALRNPVDKSYRAMLNGIHLFENMRARAPQAHLRYKLLPRQFDTDMHNIVVKLMADSFSEKIPVAADQTFHLENNRLAQQENASVMTNRRADSLTWRVEIKTPGLPGNVRRLGDLRLECYVGVEAGLISSSGLAHDLMFSTVGGGCNPLKGHSGYLYFADRPIFNIRLRHQDRQMNLPLNFLYAGLATQMFSKDLSQCDCRALISRSYFLPLGDSRWPDETLVEYEFMDDEPLEINHNFITKK